MKRNNATMLHVDYIIREAQVSDGEACARIYAPYVEQTAISFELVAPSGEEMSARIEKVQKKHVWLVVESLEEEATQPNLLGSSQNCGCETPDTSQINNARCDSAEGVESGVVAQRGLAEESTENKAETPQMKILGYAYIGEFSSRAAYCKTAEPSIYLAPEARGKGIGKALLHELISRARELGYVKLVSLIAEPNEASIGLHEKSGFTRVGTIHRAGWKFNAWHDVTYLEFDLDKE